jgi:hypothetical protein
MWVDADWLQQLATSGATTLVGAAATDVWQQARKGFARLLGRSDSGQEELAAKRLDALTAAVEQADVSERDMVRRLLLPAWQTELRDLLKEDPTTANTLRGLRDELQALLPTAQQQWVQHINASAPGAKAQGVMFGNIINHDPHLPSAADPSEERPTR